MSLHQVLCLCIKGLNSSCLFFWFCFFITACLQKHVFIIVFHVKKENFIAYMGENRETYLRHLHTGVLLCRWPDWHSSDPSIPRGMDTVSPLHHRVNPWPAPHSLHLPRSRCSRCCPARPGEGATGVFLFLSLHTHAVWMSLYTCCSFCLNYRMQVFLHSVSY